MSFWTGAAICRKAPISASRFRTAPWSPFSPAGRISMYRPPALPRSLTRVFSSMKTRCCAANGVRIFPGRCIFSRPIPRFGIAASPYRKCFGTGVFVWGASSSTGSFRALLIDSADIRGEKRKKLFTSTKNMCIINQNHSNQLEVIYGYYKECKRKNSEHCSGRSS